MDSRELKLNENKTDCILIETKQNLRKQQDISEIIINGCKIAAANEVKDLWVQQISWSHQINK